MHTRNGDSNLQHTRQYFKALCLNVTVVGTRGFAADAPVSVIHDLPRDAFAIHAMLYTSGIIALCVAGRLSRAYTCCCTCMHAMVGVIVCAPAATAQAYPAHTGHRSVMAATHGVAVEPLSARIARRRPPILGLAPPTPPRLWHPGRVLWNRRALIRAGAHAPPAGHRGRGTLVGHTVVVCGL